MKVNFEVHEKAALNSPFGAFKVIETNVPHKKHKSAIRRSAEAI